MLSFLLPWAKKSLLMRKRLPNLRQPLQISGLPLAGVNKPSSVLVNSDIIFLSVSMLMAMMRRKCWWIDNVGTLVVSNRDPHVLQRFGVLKEACCEFFRAYERKNYSEKEVYTIPKKIFL